LADLADGGVDRAVARARTGGRGSAACCATVV